MADLTPEDELGLLLEVAETHFGIAEPADYEWHVAHTRANPGEFATLAKLLRLEEAGYVSMDTGRREDDPDAPWVYANITEAGRKRISDLYGQGVKPDPSWSASSFDEGGLPPAGTDGEDASA